MKLNEKKHTLGNEAEWKNTHTRKWSWMKNNTLGNEDEWKKHQEMKVNEKKDPSRPPPPKKITNKQ